MAETKYQVKSNLIYKAKYHKSQFTSGALQFVQFVQHPLFFRPLDPWMSKEKTPHQKTLSTEEKMEDTQGRATMDRHEIDVMCTEE